MEESNIRAEIIAVGTELLLGQIVNSNAQYLSQQLASLGIDVYFQTVVGDNERRLKQALQLASKRADLIVCSGGLGPTEDDITKQMLAQFIGRGLMMHEPTLHHIQQFFKQRGSTMTENNARQALLIEGSDALPNDVGMAVGSALTHDHIHYVLLPGPPLELKTMFDRYVKQWLRQRMDEVTPLYSRILKFAGIGESALENQLIDLIHDQQDPTLAPYAMEGELALRISTKANDETQAERKLAATKQVIYERLGKHIYTEEDVTIEQVVTNLLHQKERTVSVAESCSGGLLSHMFTTIPGSSAMFKGGVVCYTNEVKANLLQVPFAILEGDGAPGAISAECARLLAEGIISLTHSDYGIAITGVAGPDQAEEKSVGLVYIALKFKDEEVQVMQYKFSGNRAMIKLRAAKMALYLLWQHLHKA